MRSGHHPFIKTLLPATKVRRGLITVCVLSVILLSTAESAAAPKVVVAVFDAGFEGIDRLSADRVLGETPSDHHPITDERCNSDRRYNGIGAYEKTWGWNFLGCGARRSNSFIRNTNHGFRMARQILEGTSQAAVLPITSVVDAAGQHILFLPPDSFREPMRMASERGAQIVNMSFALSPPYEPTPDDPAIIGRDNNFDDAYSRYLPKFEAARQAMLRMLKDHKDTVFVAAAGNAKRQYRAGRWMYVRNNLSRRLPQALKTSREEVLPNLFVVSVCDATGNPLQQVNFEKGAVDICLYRSTPHTVTVDNTSLAISHLWSSDAAAAFSNVLTRIFEDRPLSPDCLRKTLDSYPGIRRDPEGRYDFFVDHSAFSANDLPKPTPKR